jgi:uncharacterized protein YggE
VEDLARARAVTQAVTHAKAMAGAAGRALGPVCSLRDQTQVQAPEPFPGNAILGATSAASGAVPVPIEAGSQSESDQITLVYALVSPPAPAGGRR